MAWVEQCGSRSWRVRYRRPGSGVRSVSGFGSRRDAVAYAAGLEVDRRRRVWIDPADSAVTVAEWVARWFRSLNLDPRTIESYRSRLRCHLLPKFGDLPLVAITALGVTEWVRELERAGYAPSTVSSQLNLLSMLLTDAVDERLIPFNPVRRRRRRGRRSRRAVPERIWATSEQVVRIAEQAGLLGGPIARLLVITAAWTGCRWGELAGLHRDNVDLRRGVIVIDPLVGALHESGSMRWLGPPKTRASARTIALPPFLVALLREHLARHRYEFVHDAEREVVVALDVHPARLPPRGRRQRGVRDQGGLRGGPTGVDLPRATAQPQDLADRRRRTGDRPGPPARSPPGQPGHRDLLPRRPGGRAAAARRSRAPLAHRGTTAANTVTECGRRWAGGAGGPPLRHGGGHSPPRPGSTGNTAPTVGQGWGGAPVLPHQEHKITPQADHR